MKRSKENQIDSVQLEINCKIKDNQLRDFFKAYDIFIKKASQLTINSGTLDDQFILLMSSNIKRKNQ